MGNPYKQLFDDFESHEHESDVFQHSQEINDFRQIEIVPTTINKYITGIYALNIPDEEGSTGDWHSSVFWQPKNEAEIRKITLGGEGDFDTNHIFGDMGVSESYERLENIGIQIGEHIGDVYVANHIRATLDLAYSELKRYGQIWYVKGCTIDWLDSEVQKQNLLQNASKLKNYFKGDVLKALNEWLEYEKNLSL